MLTVVVLSAVTTMPVMIGLNVTVGGQSMTVTLGTVQLSVTPGPNVSSSSIAPQQVKPSIIPTRKKVYWKSSGDN